MGLTELRDIKFYTILDQVKNYIRLEFFKHHLTKEAYGFLETKTEPRYFRSKIKEHNMRLAALTYSYMVKFCVYKNMFDDE